VGPENAGMVTAGQKCRDGKYSTGKYWTNFTA